MLKEDGGNREMARQIHRCVQKITDHDIELLLLEPGRQSLLNPSRLEPAHGIGSAHRQPSNVAKSPPERGDSALARREADCFRKLAAEFLLVVSIGLAAVVREKYQFVT